MTALRRLTAIPVLATGAAAVAASIILGPGTSAAAPSVCADVEVIFARGTFEPPGAGMTGDAFVGALRSRLPDQQVDLYAVAYPASLDFARAVDGVIDAGNRVRHLAAQCPDTRIVLGGYSQGAAVNGYVTADALPADYLAPDGITGPLPAELADHVAAVALFGTPSSGVLNLIHRDAPPIAIGAAYAPKTVFLCAPADPVCGQGGFDRAAHSIYTMNGMTEQAAEFAAQLSKRTTR